MSASYDEPETARRVDESGAVATEYVFLASLVALVIVTAASFLGEQVRAILAAVGRML